MNKPNTQSDIVYVQYTAEQAEIFGVYVCSDRHVHLTMADKNNNAMGEIVYEPEDALTIAQKITEAADRAMGI